MRFRFWLFIQQFLGRCNFFEEPPYFSSRDITESRNSKFTFLGNKVEGMYYLFHFVFWKTYSLLWQTHFRKKNSKTHTHPFDISTRPRKKMAKSRKILSQIESAVKNDENKSWIPGLRRTIMDKMVPMIPKVETQVSAIPSR